MLSIIKATIEHQPDISFTEYYNSYIMSVQDRNLEKEISYLLAANDLNVLNMSKLIKHTFEGIKNL